MTNPCQLLIQLSSLLPWPHHILLNYCITPSDITKYTIAFIKNHTTNTHTHITFFSVIIKTETTCYYRLSVRMITLTTSTNYLDSDYLHWTTPLSSLTRVHFPGYCTHTQTCKQCRTNKWPTLHITDSTLTIYYRTKYNRHICILRKYRNLHIPKLTKAQRPTATLGNCSVCC